MNLSKEKLEKYLAELGEVKPLFDRFPGQTMAQVSLRFCISHEACHTVIPGAKTIEQVEDNCAASDLGPIDSALIPGQ
jgi:aryl-alcohol dehydrogenase-like predicted oxidoreductase